MTRVLIIVGASGFGREAADVVESMGSRVAGVLDDGPSQINLTRLRMRGIAYLGTLGAWLQGRPEPVDYLIGIGNPRVRERIAAVMDGSGHTSSIAIHPSSTIGTESAVGPGTVICAGVQVSTNVTIGRHVHLNPNATVGHDTALADFVSVNPAATVAGDVRIGARTLLGSGCNVLQQLTVGSDVTVGAAALVTRPVPDFVTVKGIPGRW